MVATRVGANVSRGTDRELTCGLPYHGGRVPGFQIMISPYFRQLTRVERDSIVSNFLTGVAAAPSKYKSHQCCSRLLQQLKLSGGDHNKILFVPALEFESMRWHIKTTNGRRGTLVVNLRSELPSSSSSKKNKSSFCCWVVVMGVLTH